jgi:hypothetical protein
MKACLFWVKERWSEKIIPVFDVCTDFEINSNSDEDYKIYFLVFIDGVGFCYENEFNYSPVANEGREACFDGAE